MWVLAALAVLMPAALYAQTPAEPDTPEPQTIRETVTVTAPAPSPPPERATLRHIVDDHALVSLPLNGRNVMALTALAPSART